MKIFRFALCLLFTLPTLAPVVAADTYKYAIKYERQHYFYQHDDEMNVIDIDVEWPTMLNGDRAEGLQRHLTSWLFGMETTDFSQARDAFLHRFGEPVTGQLATIPDDNKFCYVHVSLREVGFVADRYIALQATYNCAPQPASSQQADSRSELFTYDIAAGEILTTQQILKSSLFNDPINYQLFAYALAENALGELPDTVNANHWPHGIGVDAIFTYFDLGYPNAETGQNTLSRIPTEQVEGLFSKKFQRQRKTPVPIREATSDSWAQEGNCADTIYLTADTMPRYEQDKAALHNFLIQNIKIPVEEAFANKGGRIVFSFVVEPDGTLSHITILLPYRPTIDRELIGAIRQLHRWQPGIKDGKPVRVRIKMPVTIRMQN